VLFRCVLLLVVRCVMAELQWQHSLW
jgi:hypothetical protein